MTTPRAGSRDQVPWVQSAAVGKYMAELVPGSRAGNLMQINLHRRAPEDRRTGESQPRAQ
jgi:hypothetical protein